MPQHWAPHGPVHAQALAALPVPRQPWAPHPQAPRQPRSLTWAIVSLGGFSLFSPVIVLILGFLAYALQWLFAMAMVVFTFGAIAADPKAEAWINGVVNGDAFDSWMAGLLPWAGASLVVTVLVGGLILFGLRRTSAQFWHPVLQGMLSGLAGVLTLVALAGLILAI